MYMCIYIYIYITFKLAQ